jgi:hypothetical protein
MKKNNFDNLDADLHKKNSSPGPGKSRKKHADIAVEDTNGMRVDAPASGGVNENERNAEVQKEVTNQDEQQKTTNTADNNSALNEKETEGV